MIASWRKRWIAALSGLCLGLALWLGLASPLLAQPQTPIQIAQVSSLEELQRQQQQIDQQRSRVVKERDRLKNMEKNAQGNLQGIQRNIQATSSQIQANEARLAKAEQKLKTLQATLAKAEQAYQQKQGATTARLRYLQRQQTSRGWAVLLQSQNLNEFLDRRYQLKRVYQADRQMLSQLKQEAKRVEQQKLRVEQQKNEIALLTQQLQAQKSEFEAQANTQQQLIGRLRNDRQALEAAEAQLAADSQSVAGLIQQRVSQERARGTLAYRGTGQFIFPSVGPITSGFGWRVHPILGYQRFHAGVDFGAEYGSTIRAADSGVVIFAGWYGGYGNAVIIDHGNGISTLYGHASELYVSENQTVQRGQPIAAVGSTGLSTGPHLHFEVRRNGDPIDPMAYL